MDEHEKRRWICKTIQGEIARTELYWQISNAAYGVKMCEYDIKRLAILKSIVEELSHEAETRESHC
jgi:hypothetical protein